MSDLKELNIQPREYQKSIFETCKKSNCLVVLPTGTGKTLIAVMLSIQRFKLYPLEKILILAPTRPLVEQHFNTFKKFLPENWADMQIFTGKTPAEERKKIWQTSEFIFSTPQCIANDLKNNLYNLTDVSLLIEDECHRCLKNYAYNFIAQQYKQQSLHPRILGLTASPGSDKQTINKVCANLGIEQVEIRTRDSEDVKPYLQELEFQKIELEFPPEFEEIRLLLKEIYNRKIQELKNRKVLFIFPTKTNLLQTQKKISNQLNTNARKNPSLFTAASVCAQAIKLQHALELLETQTLASFITYLKKLFSEAEQQKSKASQRLVKAPEFTKAYTLATTLNKEHPKLEKILNLVKTNLSKNKNAKIIIFAQYRETVKKIANKLKTILNASPTIFVGQTIKKHAQEHKSTSNKTSAQEAQEEQETTTGLNQKQQKQIISKFSSGEFNVLVATSIGEEGLDIPEVNEVIFYEPVPSAIRKIQRTGRTARLQPGALKILITKNTRDQAYHYASTAKEKRMHSAIEEIKQNLNKSENLNKEEKEQKKLF